MPKTQNIESKSSDKQYNLLIQHISSLVYNAKKQVATAIDSALVETYWNIGKGYSKSNLFNMRLFYSRFPIFQTVSGKLGWSHIIELIYIDNELERNFYLAESISENWSVRTLKQQKERGLFMQLALGKNRDKILELSKKGNIIEQPEDIIKDTYTLDFLNISEQKHSESVLEDALIENLEHFLLELGKGFAFVGRQCRLTVNNTNYYADLVFYHIILKCYVVIDLKIGKVKQEDIGQMNLYLGYFAIDKNNEGDNPPIGIILCADNSEVVAEFALGGLENQIFASKYTMFIPNKEQLIKQVEYVLEQNELEALETGEEK